MGINNNVRFIKLNSKISLNDLGILNVLLVENFDIQCEFISHQLYLVLKDKEYLDINRKLDSIESIWSDYKRNGVVVSDISSIIKTILDNLL